MCCRRLEHSSIRALICPLTLGALDNAKGVAAAKVKPFAWLSSGIEVPAIKSQPSVHQTADPEQMAPGEQRLTDQRLKICCAKAASETG